MPRLTDIAIIKTGKQILPDTQKGLYALRRTLPQPELSLKNKLRTNLTIGDESKMKGFELPVESNGVYASWRKELEKAPKYDLYESKPLNQVKSTDKEDVENLMLSMKHNEWLKEINERIKRLRLKP